ncbi:arginyl-tRNA synthetase [Rhypophila sp. PSN 637]
MTSTADPPPSFDLSGSGVSQSEYPAAYPDLNPLDYYRILVADRVSKTLEVDRNLVFSSVDRTTTPETGDLSLPVPRLRLKGIPLSELAEKVAAIFEESQDLRAEASGVAVRFWIGADQLFSRLIPLVIRQGDVFGGNPNLGLRDASNRELGSKTVIVEFSSPNIAKKFHAGHLRSTIIGGFLSNLLESFGYNVIRMNYLGDWGRQYGLLACGWKRYGNEEAFAKDPISHLFDIYVRISADFQPEEDAFKAATKRGEDTSQLESQGLLGDAKAYFKRMEEGDEEALQLWRRFRQLSIERYKATYARLNIHFTDYSGESQVKQETMERAEKILQDHGITELDAGAVIIDFKKHNAKKLDVAIIRNRNGTSNYLLRDIGAALQRDATYHFDQMYYIVMSEQEAHLARLFKTLELMDKQSGLSKKMKHVSFGKVMGMSTRKGTVKFLDDIISDVGDFMHGVMRRNEAKYNQVEDPDKTAEILGISAIMIQDMAGKRINNYEFSYERMTSFEGDTGPYLQYAHARLCSIFRKVDFTKEELLDADYSSLTTSPHAIKLLRSIARFPDMTTQALRTLEPTTIVTYLFKLTHDLSSSYDHLKVFNPPEGRAVALARAALYEAAHRVLRNGMVLLGLTPLERM